jgi:hypothetical protein
MSTHDDWQNAVLPFLQSYAKKAKKQGANFLAEDFIHAARVAGLPQPHDPRNYGAVIRQAAVAKIIKKVGYKPARTSHGNRKSLWEAA